MMIGGRLVVASLMVSLSISCVSYRTPNVRIEQISETRGYRPHANPHHRGSGKIWMLVTFSGGGTRAAAFAYGVLEELRDTSVVVEGQRTRLLDEVDSISGVSGGSFPAAYFGLFGDRIFDDFEERFVRRNVQRAMLLRALIPWNLVALMTPAFSRTALASDYYAKHVFDEATFADLEAGSGPMIFINSTDLTDGNRFTFSQPAFDVICSDLEAFPVSSAVAASSAVPGLLSPLTLRNYAGECDFEPPAWYREALASRESDPRRYRAAMAALPYMDQERKRYIHLVDGGIADNLGLRVALERVDAAGGIERMIEIDDWTPPDHMIIIVVNAETTHDPAFDLSKAAPGLVETMNLVSGAQIRRINFDTLDLIDSAAREWTRELSGPNHEVTAHVVEVSFDHVRDEKERTYLKRLPTSFSLSEEQVDRLVEAGRRLLRESPQYQEVLEQFIGDRN